MDRDAIRRALAGLLLALLLAGCAQPRQVMRADPELRAGAAAQLWPAAPETPRYRYVGQLLGEDNFGPEHGDTGGAGTRLLHWLVGLGSERQDKVTLKRPQSGTVDAQGRVYVTDVSNHAVFVFDQPGAKLLVWNMAQERRAFVTPVGIAIGAGGQVLVADAELGQVFRLDRDGKPLGAFGQGILVRPAGLARDAARGRIYVADTHAHDVKVFDDAGALLEVIGRRGEGEGELNFPTHLSFGDERLYVADSMNARVVMFDAQGKPAGTLGRRGLYIGNLTRPKGVALGPEGTVYVVESMHDSLLVFNREGQFLMPIGGTGRQVGQFYLPAGAWTDPQGRVYVADMFNGRVVMFQFMENK
ncbi:MAG: 6-bladed beta-propeller [Telluria sp.]|nr:6-bladed beta-propeller [Telluria sp.]